MESVVETSINPRKDEPRKEWVTPELKKIDIEQITAHGRRGRHSDGSFWGRS